MERTFDRVPRFDEKSRQYPIRTVVGSRKPRSYTWSCGSYLDQGREGACVGFAWAHEAAARPAVVPVTEGVARGLYRRAQKLDVWPGEAYEGTSVLAGAKAFVEAGYATSYRWAFGADELALAVGYAGPAVIGVNWYEGMFVPDVNGYVHPAGRVLGGHAILVRAVSVPRRDFTLRNSWGRGWGRGGDCRITWDNMATLLSQQGEACIPLGRKRP